MAVGRLGRHAHQEVLAPGDSPIQIAKEGRDEESSLSKTHSCRFFVGLGNDFIFGEAAGVVLALDCLGRDVEDFPLCLLDLLVITTIFQKCE